MSTSSSAVKAGLGNFPWLFEKQLVIEHIFDYHESMELGDPTAGERTECSERSQPDVILDKLNNDLAELLETVESGGLDHLSAAEKISFWKRFETFRNRLPLIDHALIADAQATDLATEYCFSNLTMLLTRRLQLSQPKPPPEYEQRQRSARGSPSKEAMEPVLPRLLPNALVRSRPSRCRLWPGPCRNSPDPT